MNFLNHIFHRHRPIALSILFILIVIVLVKASASTPYVPGATLNPAEGPGDSFVQTQWTNSGNDIYSTNSGNIGIGTATPNSPLEVAGVIHSTSGGFKFPDDTTQTTAATGGASYQVYTALLSQSGSEDPTVNGGTNSSPGLNSADSNYLGDITWTRDSQGNYIGTLNAAFPDQNKVFLKINSTFAGGSNELIPFAGIGWNDANSIYVTSFILGDATTYGPSPRDDGLYSTSIEIRVYP